MNTFKEWMTLQEGMSVYITGYSGSDNIKDFESISEIIKRKVINPLWSQLKPEEQDAVRKAGSLHHGILTVDGSYYSRDKKEIMNLYTAGWPDNLLEKMISGVKYYLDAFNVKYSSFIKDKSGMFDGDPVIRIPVLSWKKTTGVPPSLDLNNANARLIFGDILGFPGEEGGFYNISPADLITKIDNLDNDSLELHARDAYTSQRPGRAQMFNGGIDENGLAQRLQKIRDIAQWAMKNNYDNIYVA